MSYTITDDGNSKSACYGYVVTGYLKSFTKEMKEADGTEPTKHDFMEEIQKIVDNAKEVGIKSGVGQVERGQNGTVHWQGYYQFNKKQKFRTFQNKLAKICDMSWNLQEAMASTEKNVEYSTKGTGEFTYASGAVKYSEQLSQPVWINEKDLVLKKGKRSDLAAVNKAIDEGMSMEDIAREFPNAYVRYTKGLGSRVFLRDSKAARSRAVNKQCFLLYGPTGTGKTHDVLTFTFPEKFGFTKEDVFIVDGGNGKKLWFDGYTNQRVLLIDELEPQQIPRTTLLRILDDVSYRGEIKNGFTDTHFDFIFITSNYSPDELFLKKHTKIERDEYDNQFRIVEWVEDHAMLHRFNFICNYSGRKDFRKEKKKLQRINMNDAKSVASLLPATLAFGTVGDESQCGSERVQPSPNSPPATTNGKKKIQLDILGDRDDSDESTLAPYANGRLI
jgi:hypothetical protein